jgi:hypothetical protein
MTLVVEWLVTGTAGEVSIIYSFAAKRRKTTCFEASKQLLALAKCFGISGPF